MRPEVPLPSAWQALPDGDRASRPSHALYARWHGFWLERLSGLGQVASSLVPRSTRALGVAGGSGCGGSHGPPDVPRAPRRIPRVMDCGGLTDEQSGHAHPAPSLVAPGHGSGRPVNCWCGAQVLTPRPGQGRAGGEGMTWPRSTSSAEIDLPLGLGGRGRTSVCADAAPWTPDRRRTRRPLSTREWFLARMSHASKSRGSG